MTTISPTPATEPNNGCPPLGEEHERSGAAINDPVQNAAAPHRATARAGPVEQETDHDAESGHHEDALYRVAGIVAPYGDERRMP